MARRPRIELPPYEEPPEPYERRSPLDRYAHLPTRTREWLEGLREEDLRELEAARRFYAQAKSVGKFNLWILGIMIAASATGATFGEKVLAFINLLRGSS